MKKSKLQAVLAIGILKFTDINEGFLCIIEARKIKNEVENAITAYADEQDREHSLQLLAVAAQKTEKLAGIRYQTGLTNFTTVLDAQRSLLSAQDQLAQSNSTVTADLVRLYKALGGGWTSLADATGRVNKELPQ